MTIRRRGIPVFPHSTFLKSVLAVACAAALLQAQTAATGALTVTVKDPSGAVVPDASLTVTNDSGVTRTQRSSGDGTVTFSLLPPGDAYKLTISAPGFKVAEVPSIDIHV